MRLIESRYWQRDAAPKALEEVILLCYGVIGEQQRHNDHHLGSGMARGRLVE